jgi:tetratricopeptide (TPR) repeat protein
VQLVEAARAGGVLAGAERRAVAAWRAGGISAQQLIEAGEEARNAKRYEEALEWYERAIRLEPGSADGWYHIGVVLQEENQWEQSLYALDWAIDLEPGLARAYIAQARALAFGYGDYEEARAQAEKGLRVAPEDKEILYQAAQFFLEIQDNIRAEELFKAALALDPDNLYMWIGLGQSLFAQKRFDEALEAFKQASLIQTGTWQDAIAHAWLGNTYIALDKPCDALREYRLAAQLHPADSDNFVRLGDAYQRVGETDKALEAYQQALSINPGNEWALKRISEIQNESSPGK